MRPPPLASTFALFGPEGKTVLTAGATDNRLQLWTNPADSPRRRAVELRQFVWADGPSLCAAFDPQGGFVVTGTRDRQVLVWQMPLGEEVREPDANATISSIVKAAVACSRARSESPTRDRRERSDRPRTRSRAFRHASYCSRSSSIRTTPPRRSSS